MRLCAVCDCVLFALFFCVVLDRPFIVLVCVFVLFVCLFVFVSVRFGKSGKSNTNAKSEGFGILLFKFIFAK